MHLNGYKISGPTAFGRMNDTELTDFFTGASYIPRIVDGENHPNLDEQMDEAMDWARGKIEEARNCDADKTPHLPMIIMRTAKGMTWVKRIKWRKVGNALSHQVVLMEAKGSTQLKMLEKWLKSYKFNELFDH